MIQDSEIAVCGGKLLKLRHDSAELKCEAKLNVFLPSTKSAPVLIYLAGLTCTPDNGAEKSFLIHAAAQKGIAVVFPDTSPRDVGIEGEEDSYDFGTGAGFYLNATKQPWAKHYRMEAYIVDELPTLLREFDTLDLENIGITGHSMGGHGALTLFLKYPGKYKSVSAFSPIANPINAPWGQKAFSGYLQSREEWPKHDATELIKVYHGPVVPILIDVGLGDGFYKDGQLLPENIVLASQETELDGQITLRKHENYDHSYYFVSTFAADHISHHASRLLSSPQN